MAVADLVFHNIQNVLLNGRTEDVLGWRSPLFAPAYDPHVMRVLQHLAAFEGRAAAGIRALSDALRDDPENVRWRTLRAAILRHTGQPEQAVVDLAATFAAAPPDDETLRTFIDLVLQAKCYTRAVDALDQLAQRFPDNALVHDLLGSVLQLLHRNVEAIPYHERALKLDPRNADYANNFGTTLRQLGAFDEAERFLRMALQLHPGHYMAWYNLGNVLRMTRRTRESIQAYRNSISIRGDYPESHFTLACSLLQLGEWHEGWREWEWRFRSATIVPSIDIELPLWNGSDPSGKRIIVVAEQGSGDTLQFVRYTQLLAQRGAHVTIWAPKETAALLGRLPHIVAASPYRADMPEAEMYVPMMSLPRLLQSGPEAIPPAPYLAVSVDRTAQFAQALGPRRKRLRLGIAWAGNPVQGDDGFRSANLAELAPLFNDPDIEWIGVQKGPRSAEIIETGFPIADWSDALTSFDDTAALFMNLDGVVSVCTGPVHLAGAMGLPTVCMLSTAADWRWADDPTFTAWYGSMRLIRQQRQGDWHDVAIRSAELLRSLAPRTLPIDEMTAAAATQRAAIEARMERFEAIAQSVVAAEVPAISNANAKTRKTVAGRSKIPKNVVVSENVETSKNVAAADRAVTSKNVASSNAVATSKNAAPSTSVATSNNATASKKTEASKSAATDSAKIKAPSSATKAKTATVETRKSSRTSATTGKAGISKPLPVAAQTKKINKPTPAAVVKRTHVQSVKGQIAASKPAGRVAKPATKATPARIIKASAPAKTVAKNVKLSAAKTAEKIVKAAVKPVSAQVKPATQKASSADRALEKSSLVKSAIKRPANAKTAVTTRFSTKPKSTGAPAAKAKPVARKATNARR